MAVIRSEIFLHFLLYFLAKPRPTTLDSQFLNFAIVQNQFLKFPMPQAHSDPHTGRCHAHSVMGTTPCAVTEWALGGVK